MKENTGKKFERLVGIMSKLRGPKGCPWDKEQTPQSISPYLLEETYEALAAIDDDNPKEICEELGDLLLQIVFQAQMAEEAKNFDVGEVIDGISEKLIRRHPHVFGCPASTGRPALAGKSSPTSATTARRTKKKVGHPNIKEVLHNWEKIKKDEGKKSILGGVPKNLPALLKAYRIGQKASRVKFDWKDAEGILKKVEEEARELHEAKKEGNPKEIEHEYGDLLLVLANLGRFLNMDPETALRKATARFIKRFQWMEIKAERKQLNIHELSPEKMGELWEMAKKAKG